MTSVEAPEGHGVSRSIFEDLAEQSLVGMTIVLDGRFIYANAKCCELYGYSRAEFLRLTPLELVTESERETVLRRMEERLRGAARVSEYDVRGLRKDGSTIDLEVRGTTITIGDRPALATSFIDVTETRQAIQTRHREASITRQVRRERDTAQRYLDVAGVMIMVFSDDETISLVNRVGCSVLGYQSPDELLGQNWIDTFIPEPRRVGVREAFHSFLDGASPGVERFENPVLTRAGEERVISWRNQRLLDDDGNAIAILSSGEDITERRRAEDALRASEARFRQIAENLDEVFWITNADKTELEYVSPAYETVWGRPLPEAYARPSSFLEAVVAEDRPQVEQSVRQQPSGDYDVEYRIARPDGEVRWIHDRGVPIKDHDGRIYRLIGIAEDITERKLAEARLVELAHFDRLTGLPNRTFFLQRVDAAISSATAGTVILLDLDGFKKVNDSAGHHAGDLLLRTVAHRLQDALPNGSLISRWGGDEFAVFHPAAGNAREVGQTLEAIQAVCTEPFLLPRRRVFLSASVGLASAPAHGNSAEALLRNADLALYRAKASGRATSRVFTTAMKEEIQEEIELESELRRAFSNSEFEMHYQPQISLRTGALLGAEALLRWRHPKKGLLSPAAFLAVLKQSPIAVPVGDWTIRSAVAAAERLYRSGRGLRIGVNLFSAQVKAGGLAETVGCCLAAHDVPPELIELEITEYIALSDPLTLETLQAARQLGVGMSFDDYGTGYASLSKLTEYPLTRLKIDRAFVSKMSTSLGDAAIVKAIISLGEGFGLGVIAEGVENAEQATALKELGCEEAQGYLFGRPMPFDTFTQYCADYAARDPHTAPALRYHLYGRQFTDDARGRCGAAGHGSNTTATRLALSRVISSPRPSVSVYWSSPGRCRLLCLPFRSPSTQSVCPSRVSPQADLRRQDRR